jgi:hypothetical protein
MMPAYGTAMPHKKFAALLVFLWPVIALGGDASGQFTAAKRPPIKPKYAVAYETRDQRDARKIAVEVVLSEEPIDVVEAAAELDPHSNVINQKALRDHNYVLLWVRPDNDVSMNATYSDTTTQYVEMTGSRMTAEMSANTRDKVAGRIFSPKPLKTMDGDEYMIDLKFSTEVTRPPAGTKLPADGGEPGKAFNALQTAIAKKSWTGIKGNVTAKTLESFYESDRTEKENLADAIQTLAFRLPKKGGTAKGGELRGDSALLNLEGELFEGQYALFVVRMVKDGSRWVFDRAMNAGLIDK